MTDLHLAFADLRRLADQLVATRAGLLETSADLEAAAGHVGHSGLAFRLRILAELSRVERERTGRRLDELAGATRSVESTFAATDARLAGGGQ